VQVFGNAFFQRQGEVRFARTLELPANRGTHSRPQWAHPGLQRAGASIWAIPEDVERDKPEVQAAKLKLARLLACPWPS
jgi:cell division protein FtsI (penicillin-binding protein 3)